MIALVNVDPATTIPAIVALGASARAWWRTRHTARAVRANRDTLSELRREQRRQQQLIEQLRRHLRLVLAELVHANERNDELERELAAAHPQIIRARREPPHAPQD